MNTPKKQVEQIREISGVDPYKCMKCGKCSASCPSYNEMDIKPHQFVSYVLRGHRGADAVEIPLEMSVLFCLRGALSQRCQTGQVNRCGETDGAAPEGTGVSVAG